MPLWYKPSNFSLNGSTETLMCLRTYSKEISYSVLFIPTVSNFVSPVVPRYICICVIISIYDLTWNSSFFVYLLVMVCLFIPFFCFMNIVDTLFSRWSLPYLCGISFRFQKKHMSLYMIISVFGAFLLFAWEHFK